jgi:hypothetical protein
VPRRLERHQRRRRHPAGAELGPGHTIVTVLCDYGTRYQSKLFNHRIARGDVGHHHFDDRHQAKCAALPRDPHPEVPGTRHRHRHAEGANGVPGLEGRPSARA